MKICISAESTIDLPKELLEEFDIRVIAYPVIMGDEVYKDGEILPEKMFEFTEKTGVLPRTSAINSYQFGEYFRELLKEYDHIIHFSLGSGISSTCQNAINASNEDEFKGKVDIIDSDSLSTGIALLAMAARDMAKEGKDPKEIVDTINVRKKKNQASFSLESVNYLYKGGRCSALAMIGANLLKLKPAIYVHEGAKMSAGKKYRGPMMKAVMDYVNDTLEMFKTPDLTRVFITYSSAPDNVVAAVEERLKKVGFKTIYKTLAGATISSHCGPHCLGILYINDGQKA
ncbi:MAG: DegV family protein [Bacilli bacterium]|nr:DegV family protein [Bacilli bacterium]